MDTTTVSNIQIYIQILIALSVFGIGVPLAIYPRPTWSRRLKEKYSTFPHFDIFVVVVLMIILLLLLGYLIKSPITKWVIVKWFQDYANWISVFYIFISIVLLTRFWVWVSHFQFHHLLKLMESITEGRLNHNQSERRLRYRIINEIRSESGCYFKRKILKLNLSIIDKRDKRPPLERSILDLGIIGVHAEIQGDKIAVLRKLQKIAEWIPLDKDRDIRDICEAVNMTLWAPEVAGYESYQRAIEILNILLKRIEEGDRKKTRGTIIESSPLFYLKSIGSQAMQLKPNIESIEILNALKTGIKFLESDPRKAEYYYTFAVIALEKKKFFEFLGFENEILGLFAKHKENEEIRAWFIAVESTVLAYFPKTENFVQKRLSEKLEGDYLDQMDQSADYLESNTFKLDAVNAIRIAREQFIDMEKQNKQH